MMQRAQYIILVFGDDTDTFDVKGGLEYHHFQESLHGPILSPHFCHSTSHHNTAVTTPLSPPSPYPRQVGGKLDTTLRYVPLLE